MGAGAGIGAESNTNLGANPPVGFNPNYKANMASDPTLAAGMDSFPMANNSNISNSQRFNDLMSMNSGFGGGLNSFISNNNQNPQAGTSTLFNNGASDMPIPMPIQNGYGFNNTQQQQATTNPIQSFIGSNTNPYANSSSPYFQAAQAQTLGNLAGAQQALQANRVNQNTAYGGLQYQQGVDQFGNPTWTANQTTNPQTQGLINSSLGSLQASIMNPAYGINPGETATNAILRRLQPQMAQQAEQQASNLANQGIVPGTQAYDNAMRTFQQGQNDLLTSAQTAGINTGLQAQQLQNQQAANIKSLTTPSFINAPTQATVAGPDYTGALATQTNANIAAQNAALGQATNNTAGLYGLGSAGILGLAANPGLITSAGKGIGNAYDWLSNQF